MLYSFDFGVIWIAIGEVEKNLWLSLKFVACFTFSKAHSSLTFPHICGAVSEFKT